MLKYVVTAKLYLSNESGFEGRFINEDGEVWYLFIYLSACLSVSGILHTCISIDISFLSICLFLLKHTCPTCLFMYRSVSGNANYGTQRVYFRINKNWFGHSYWRKHRRLGVLNYRRNCFMEGKFLWDDDSYWFSIPVNKSRKCIVNFTTYTLSRKKFTLI